MNTSQQYPATPDFDKAGPVTGNFLFSSDTSVRQVLHFSASIVRRHDCAGHRSLAPSRCRCGHTPLRPRLSADFAVGPKTRLRAHAAGHTAPVSFLRVFTSKSRFSQPASAEPACLSIYLLIRDDRYMSTHTHSLQSLPTY